jgi:hypothetical protein
MKRSCNAYQTNDDPNRKPIVQSAMKCRASVTPPKTTVAQPWRAFAAFLSDLDRLDARVARAIDGKLAQSATAASVSTKSVRVKNSQAGDLSADSTIVPWRPKCYPVHAADRAPKPPNALASDILDRGGYDVPEDPAILCRMVRCLATSAHAVMRRVSTSTSSDYASQVGELRSRISQLVKLPDREPPGMALAGSKSRSDRGSGK